MTEIEKKSKFTIKNLFYVLLFFVSPFFLGGIFFKDYKIKGRLIIGGLIAAICFVLLGVAYSKRNTFLSPDAWFGSYASHISVALVISIVALFFAGILAKIAWEALNKDTTAILYSLSGILIFVSANLFINIENSLHRDMVTSIQAMIDYGKLSSVTRELKKQNPDVDFSALDKVIDSNLRSALNSEE